MRGGSIKGVLAELLGRQDGMSHGKGGSMHIFTPSFFGGNGIVGAQVPVGAGLAFAQKYLGNKAATFALYGDGASNQGQVFEAFNMVCALLPDLVSQTEDVCALRQNCGTSLVSLCAKTTSMVWVHRQSVVPPTPNTLPVVTRSLASRSVSFIPYHVIDATTHTQVNGMDIIASKHAVEYARNWVVEGNGPILMEFVTYRYGGHSYAPLLPMTIPT